MDLLQIIALLDVTIQVTLLSALKIMVLYVF